MSTTKSVILSDTLIHKLKSIDHFIAKKLIEIHNSKEITNLKFSYIDIDNNDNGMMTYLSSNKEINRESGQELPILEKWTIKSRTSVRVGTLIRAILNAKEITFNDKDIEEFSNKYRTSNVTYKFELVKGIDIIKWYNNDKYNKSNNGRNSLANSCMRHKGCEKFFSVYVKNDNVSLLICVDIESKKLLARAIVWHNVIINNKIKSTYVDRIYSYDDRMTNSIKDYIHSQGWYCKSQQGNDSNNICLGKTELKNPTIVTTIPLLNWDKLRKPYMDTFKFLKCDLKDNKFSIHLSNKSNNEHYESWSHTGGDSYMNNNELHNTFSLISKFSKTSIYDLTLDNDIFKYKSKSYKITNVNNIKYPSSIHKYINENIDCLINSKYYHYLDNDKFIKDYKNDIYQKFESIINKHILSYDIATHLPEKIFNEYYLELMKTDRYKEYIVGNSRWYYSKTLSEADLLNIKLLKNNGIKRLVGNLINTKIKKKDLLKHVKGDKLKNEVIKNYIGNDLTMSKLTKLFDTKSNKEIFEKVKKYINISKINLHDINKIGNYNFVDNVFGFKYIIEDLSDIKVKTKKNTKKSVKKKL